MSLRRFHTSVGTNPPSQSCPLSTPCFGPWTPPPSMSPTTFITLCSTVLPTPSLKASLSPLMDPLLVSGQPPLLSYINTHIKKIRSRDPYLKENMQCLSFCTWIILLSMIFFQFHSFYCKFCNFIFILGWIKFHCIYVSHFHCPLLRWWPSRLIPFACYIE